ncbi:lipopolysaccharide export LptBFGC system permease protein LptF [Bacillus mesophilus]|uniref:YwmB family TATA-box binding protein n=1 Tax=Bacillus mesophilus TaxID=1808955 RepID=A0A6M0QC16_9BACI|nr:YwmB family TATA-box binding protein [Bacillus mesophilus]MBM7663171.1 lipopolysaccharide export LptBFGC system permease protein LptF [Bacillus mesophilus]NEY73855.1 hypothetical protein [Bacillus mesophilus]
MKLIGMVLSMFVLFNIIPNSQNQMVEIVEMAEGQGITINSWKIYMQEAVLYASTDKEAKQKVNELKTYAQDFEFYIDKQEHHEDHYQLMGEKTGDVDAINEVAIITVYEDDHNKRISLSFEITGNEWSSDTWNYLKRTYKEQVKNPNVYYSVYGSKAINNSLNISDEAGHILDYLEAEPIEGMTEEDFISISAYKEDWEMEIKTNGNKAFNVQIGLRANPETNQFDIAIGTPIITSGY